MCVDICMSISICVYGENISSMQADDYNKNVNLWNWKFKGLGDID